MAAKKSYSTSEVRYYKPADRYNAVLGEFAVTVYDGEWMYGFRLKDVRWYMRVISMDISCDYRPSL